MLCTNSSKPSMRVAISDVGDVCMVESSLLSNSLYIMCRDYSIAYRLDVISLIKRQGISNWSVVSLLILPYLAAITPRDTPPSPPYVQGNAGNPLQKRGNRGAAFRSPGQRPDQSGVSYASRL